MHQQNSKIRERQGSIAGFVGIIVNVLLAGCKIAVGSIFGVLSLVADGLNNMTDCGNSIISIVSFKLSSRPADKEHPYGHERIEYVCSMIVAFLVLLVAFDTVKEGINKIIEPTQPEFSIWIILALFLSIVGKFTLYFYYSKTAKKIDSAILKASAVDSLTDCISTSVVILSVVIGKVFGLNVDGYASIIVALFIAWSAVGIFREIFSKLIGQAPDSETIEFIKNKIKSYEKVIDIHDLSVYCYGPNKYFASVHIEVDAKENVMVSHELVDDIERDFATTTNIILTGHLDPIVTDNPIVNEVKEKVVTKVKELNKDFSVHDFRMVFGERTTNVLFDVAIPYESAMSKAQVLEKVKDIVCSINPTYRAVVTVEYCI